MADWGRTTAVTIANYIKDQENNTMRDHPLLALLQSRGRVEFNVSGSRVERRIQYKQSPLVGYADGDKLSYTRRNRWVVAVLNQRGYYASDSYGKAEKLANRGQSQVVDLVGGMAERLMEDVNDNFAMQLYGDGNAQGAENFICGLETAFGNGGAAPNGYVGIPDDTYAELNTDLADKGGGWQSAGGNSTWPMGRGTPEYDYWSPLIIDYTDTAWKAATKTWANTCGEAMRFALQYSQKNASSRGETDLILLDRELMRDFLDNNDAKQTINVNRGQASALTALGFTKAINFDGASLISGFGLPWYNSAPLGYGLNVDQMLLWSMQEQLFVADMYEDKETKSTNMDVDYFGNLWFNPRYQFTVRKIT